MQYGPGFITRSRSLEMMARVIEIVGTVEA